MVELVTVVIPTYEREKELYEAIESVISQTYKHIEILIIDDNSHNLELRKKINDFIKQNYKQIKLIQNVRNLGGSGSRNVGIKSASGKYIAFLDDDDEFYPNKIEIFMKERFDKNGKEFDFIYSGCVAKDYKTKNVIREYNEEIENKNLFLFYHMCSNICATSQMMIKKDILVKVQGFPNVQAKQDYLLVLKLLLDENISVHKINKVLSVYYEHNNNRISSASLKRIKAEEEAYIETKKYFDRLKIKEIRKVEISYKKRVFNIAYLMNDKVIMWEYLKEILKQELYITGIIKILFGQSIVKKIKKITY